MVRTQIQLTEGQAKQLKAVSLETGMSMSELIRRGVDVILQQAGAVHPVERRKRAAQQSGRFHSSHIDISKNHDDYLDKAYQQ